MSTNDSQSLAQQTTLHLLDEVRAGNEAAVSLLYKRHLARLQRWARGRLPRGARELMDTDDLVPQGHQTASSVEAFGPSPLEELVGREKLDRYERGLSQLSVSDREIVVARLELGLSYNEIAKELGKPSADAARMAVTRAVTRLAEEVRSAKAPTRG